MENYPKVNASGQPVFVKFPMKISQKMIDRAYKDNLQCASLMKVGKYVSVMAVGKKMIAVPTNAKVFWTESACADACSTYNSNMGFTDQEVEEAILFTMV